VGDGNVGEGSAGAEPSHVRIAPTSRGTRLRGGLGRRKRRRPTGAPPPLPRSLGRPGRVWITLIVVSLVALIALPLVSALKLPWIYAADDWILLRLADLRNAALSSLMRMVNRIAYPWPLGLVRLAAIVALIVYRRWRFLLVFLGVVFAAEALATLCQELLRRPRPFNIEIIGPWSGSAMPSVPFVALALTLYGIIYSLVPDGRTRTTAKWVAGVVLGAFAFARMYLAIDHPTDLLVALIIGVGFPAVAFRYFTPPSVFPVTWGGPGNRAHLEISGPRTQAIRSALRDQLGVVVTQIKPVGLAASGGSTPMRITLEPPMRISVDSQSGESNVFAKLLATTHLRSDRWYKRARFILYGGLEDEVAFNTVRRLAEAEDYRERLVRDAGIRTANPLGIVELTPEREYLVVTEFFDGAVELSKADVDEAVIDQGLQLVMKLWEAGIAHRDIKPANLMVRDGELLLIDVGFAAVRPTPYRQAIDLANMMLCLALRSDAPTVYARAQRHFSPDEIAEAFAADDSIAIPSELRVRLKEDGRRLLDEFRALAPARDRISIQRWSFRRVAYAAVALVVLVLATVAAIQIVIP
jgi:tRNA A-37 threonylcarbamoyl transferase component Bud32